MTELKKNYYFIKKEYIDHIRKVVSNKFSKLITDDLNTITKYLIDIIDHISIKFSFNPIEFNKYWIQFTQNNNRDILGLLNILLPYISETVQPKEYITNLNDIYISKINNNVDFIKEEPRYIYSNIQYNRCNRDNDDIKEIKYNEEHLVHNYKLLLETINTVSNKLYVNWINIRPVECPDIIVNVHNEKEFDRIKKQINSITDKYYFLKNIDDINIYDNTDDNHRSDIYAGDIYDSLIDIIYYSKNIIWLIKKPNRDSEQINLTYLREYLNIDPIFDNLIWKQLDVNIIEDFNIKWNNFINGIGNIDDKVISYFVRAFDKYARITPTIEKWDLPKDVDINTLHKEVKKVSSENIYNFIYEQYTELRNTYFGKIYITKDNKVNNVNYTDLELYHKYLTVKMSPYKRWRELSKEDKNKILERLSVLEPNNILKTWRAFIKYIVFDYLTYNGLLSTFVPTPELTDEILFPKQYQEKNKYILDKINKLVFSNLDLNNKKYYYYLSNSLYTDHYFITKNGDKVNYINAMKNNSISSMSFWYTMFVMDWISQIHFYHKYMNNRIMYVTGGTGVGKSSQVPKLLLYALKMIDHQLYGKISCSVPRRTLVLSSSNTLGDQMGVPLYNYVPQLGEDIPSSNFYITYQHSQDKHISSIKSTIPNIKICTDGVLLQDIVTNTLLKEGYIDDKNNFVFSPTFRNKYDIVIIDEAHEHNINMDMILTIMRNYLFYNNQIKLVIISATMDEDEPYYRRFYRDINDNRMYPFDQYLIENKLDRINVDRRIDLSPPDGTIYKIDECYLNECLESNINPDQLVLTIANKSNKGNILYFQPGRGEISKSVKYLNTVLPKNMIAIPYYSEMRDDKKRDVEKIDQKIKEYILPRSIPFDFDINKLDKSKISYVPMGTYDRAVIVSTNIAEASITFPGLVYVVDTGTKKITDYDYHTRDDTLYLRDISESSRKQRRGRVGRIGPGQVYYTYQRGVMENNKESYKISTSNISEVLYSALKNNEDNNILFEDINPNDSTLKLKTKDSNIISFIRLHYNYDYKPDSFIKYQGNPDHYDYNNSKKPPSMYQTGFTKEQLDDNNGEFYIIHPEELNIIRNMIGNIVGIKENDLDKESLKIIDVNQNKKTIISKKMISFWNILLENNLIYYDNDICKKTDYGSRLFDIRRLMIETPLQDIVNIVYSYAYGCMNEIIMIISLCAAVNNNIELLYAKPVKKFNSDLMVIKDISLIIYNYLKKKINLVTDPKKIYIKKNTIEYNTKKQYLEFKKTGLINNPTNINKNIFKKIAKLDAEQKIKISDDIHIDDVRQLFISDTYIKQFDEIISKIEYKLWCMNNNFSPDVIYKVIKIYLNILTNLNKYDNGLIERDIVNMSTDNQTNTLSYFKDYLKPKILITDNLDENIRRSFIHSYSYNLLKKVTNNYYLLVTSPSINNIYKINYLDSLSYGDYIICKYKDNSKNKAFITFKAPLNLILKLTPNIFFKSINIDKKNISFSDNIKYLLTNKLPINIDSDMIVAYKNAIQDLTRDLNKNIL
jgi:hypothetical protein